LYKLALNGGMTCPNRDGLIDTRGCVFCSSGGSGDFTGDAIMRQSRVLPSQLPSLSSVSLLNSDTVSGIDAQIEAAKQLVSRKYSQNRYIAYFQSYTNTYADTDYLRKLFTSVITRPDICILSIATRPDCLNAEIIQLLGYRQYTKIQHLIYAEAIAFLYSMML
jgi:radical SAM superfamily enzyme